MRPDCTVDSLPVRYDKNAQNLILPLLLYVCEEWSIIYMMGRTEAKGVGEWGAEDGI